MKLPIDVADRYRFVGRSSKTYSPKSGSPIVLSTGDVFWVLVSGAKVYLSKRSDGSSGVFRLNDAQVDVLRDLVAPEDVPAFNMKRRRLFRKFIEANRAKFTKLAVSALAKCAELRDDDSRSEEYSGADEFGAECTFDLGRHRYVRTTLTFSTKNDRLVLYVELPNEPAKQDSVIRSKVVQDSVLALRSVANTLRKKYGISDEEPHFSRGLMYGERVRGHAAFWTLKINLPGLGR